MASADGLLLLGEFIEAPERAARTARTAPPAAFAVLAYLFAAASAYVAQGVAGREAVFGLSWLGLSLALIWNLGTGFLLAAVIHLFAESFGGRGRVVPLFVLLGFSEMAWGLALPAVLVLKVFFPEGGWPVRLAFPAIGLLILVLKARSIRHNYGFGRVPAWISLFAPYVAVAVSVFLAFVSSVLLVVQKISNIVP